MFVWLVSFISTADLSWLHVHMRISVQQCCDLLRSLAEVSFFSNLVQLKYFRLEQFYYLLCCYTGGPRGLQFFLCCISNIYAYLTIKLTLTFDISALRTR